MKLHDYLIQHKCEPRLATLIGKIIPGAVAAIRRGIEKDERGLVGTRNGSGDSQIKLDVISNSIVIDALRACGLVRHMASEEEENLIDGVASGQFTVAFDPLDGSSLADVNMAVGSIFGVYPPASPIAMRGDDQLAACYAVYGPRTTLVVTVGSGVHEFILSEDGEFHLRTENMRINDDARYFAPGNARHTATDERYLDVMNRFFVDGKTLRYSGGMVPDINHIFLKGSGVFLYPGGREHPVKLRQLFEANPMALLIEQAGGAALDGTGRILDKRVAALHQRTAVFLGSKNTVADVCKILKI